MDIGFIGRSNRGGPMARRLIEAGHTRIERFVDLSTSPVLGGACVTVRKAT